MCSQTRISVRQYLRWAIDWFCLRCILVIQIKKDMIDRSTVFRSTPELIGQLLRYTNQTCLLFILCYSSQINFIYGSRFKTNSSHLMLLLLAWRWSVLSSCLFLCNLFVFFLFSLHTYLHVDFFLNAFFFSRHYNSSSFLSIYIGPSPLFWLWMT